jgi:hypothetical protein
MMEIHHAGEVNGHRGAAYDRGDAFVASGRSLVVACVGARRDDEEEGGEKEYRKKIRRPSDDRQRRILPSGDHGALRILRKR